MTTLTDTIEVPEGMRLLETLDRTGDTKLTWDSTNAVERDNARRTFQDLKSRGFMAFSVKGKKGAKGEVLQSFDETAERIIMTPPLAGG